MSEKLEYVSNNIKSLRIRAGLLQEDVANKLNIARETYCSYELNPSKLKLETYYKLSEIFNCNIQEFFLEHNVTQSD